MLFALDEWLGVEAQHLAEFTQEQGRRFHPDRRLQVWLVEHLGETPAKLAIHHDIGVGVHEVPHLGQVRTQRHHHVHVGADPFDETPDFREVGGHVERAVHRPEDVHARLCAVLAFLFGRHPALGHAEFGEEPRHRAVGGLPLIFVDRTRQEPLNIRALRCHAATDHLGDGPGDDDGRQRRIEHLPGALHRFLGPAAHLFLAEPGHHDGQFVRRQRVGVVQDGRHRQVLATHRAVDHHLQTLHGAEGIDGTPVAASAVMVLDQHAKPPEFMPKQSLISCAPLRRAWRPCRVSSAAAPGSRDAGSARPPRHRLCRHCRRLRRILSFGPSGLCRRWRH